MEGQPVWGCRPQFQTDVVCGFVKIIAPVQDAVFMHNRPERRSGIAVSEGAKPECSSGFYHGHCTSPQCSVHVPARPKCAFSGRNSPPCPGCLVGCCTVHCTHSICSPQGANRPRRVPRTPNVLSHVCRFVHTMSESTRNAAPVGVLYTVLALTARSTAAQMAREREPGERRTRDPQRSPQCWNFQCAQVMVWRWFNP